MFQSCGSTESKFNTLRPDILQKIYQGISLINLSILFWLFVPTGSILQIQIQIQQNFIAEKCQQYIEQNTM